MATPLRPIARTDRLRHYARWRLADGTEIETDLTEEAYLALGLKGAGEPDRKEAGVPADATWLRACGGAVVWDSADGRVPFGGYVELSNGRVALGVGALDPISVKLDTGRLSDLTDARQILDVEGERFRLSDGTLERL